MCVYIYVIIYIYCEMTTQQKHVPQIILAYGLFPSWRIFLSHRKMLTYPQLPLPICGILQVPHSHFI